MKMLHKEVLNISNFQAFFFFFFWIKFKKKRWIACPKVDVTQKRHFQKRFLDSKNWVVSDSILLFLNLTLCHFFIDGVQLPQGYRATTRRQFTFYHKFPEILGTRLTDLRRMKNWVDLGATQWFWTRHPWIGSSVS